MSIGARVSYLSVICLTVLAVSSCSRCPYVQNPTFVGVPGTQAPLLFDEYRIGPGDQIEIKFFYNPELNESFTVRPDGKISPQLIDEVTAAGLTPVELGKTLKEMYATELASPVVTVVLRTSSSQKIFVDGEVGHAGVVPLSGPMTVAQAIISSGGLKETARPHEIIVIRKKDDSSGYTYIVVDEKGFIQGTDTREDIMLRPYDIVYVPSSPIADVGKFMDLYVRNILAVPNEFLIYYGIFNR